MHYAIYNSRLEMKGNNAAEDSFKTTLSRISLLLNTKSEIDDLLGSLSLKESLKDLRLSSVVHLSLFLLTVS
jgi:hypothetical protein